MTTTLRIATSLFALAALALGGCAAESEGGEVTSDSASEGNELGATVDELTTTGPTYAAGTKLVTIANLNLRSGPSTDQTVKKLMPSGSEVTVAETSGSNGWVKLSFGGFTGFGHTSYLTEVGDDAPSGQTVTSGEYDSTRGDKLASTANRVNGQPSRGACALEMSNSVERSRTVPSGKWRRNHAWLLANGMKNDSAYQRTVGFKYTTSLTTRTAPKGSIIGWRPGICGYNRTYGHIEIIANDSGRACSDFCGTVKTCDAGAIFIPTSL